MWDSDWFQTLCYALWNKTSWDKFSLDFKRLKQIISAKKEKKKTGQLWSSPKFLHISPPVITEQLSSVVSHPPLHPYRGSPESAVSVSQPGFLILCRCRRSPDLQHTKQSMLDKGISTAALDNQSQNESITWPCFLRFMSDRDCVFSCEPVWAHFIVLLFLAAKSSANQ